MLSNLMKRLAILGLAFLISVLGLAEVGPAYLFIDVAWAVILIAVFVVIIALGGALCDENAVAGVVNVFLVVITAACIAINLALAGIISWIFHIDFYIAYIIFDFILCLIPNKKKKE